MGRSNLPNDRHVRAFLDLNFAEKCSLDELGDLSTSDPSTCCVFRAATGLSPNQYQTYARLTRARSMLREGDSIADVAAATGFVDQSHLTRLFRKNVGITPGRYVSDRKNLQDGPSRD
jgi:AraC-like DNA-binding protein